MRRNKRSRESFVADQRWCKRDCGRRPAAAIGRGAQVLLAFDIGNTNIVAGCFKGEELLFEVRLKTDAGRTLDEYAALLAVRFQDRLGSRPEFRSCIISSVVPPVTPDIVRYVKEALQLDPLLVGPGIKTGIAIRINDPSTLGSDRIVNAVSAKKYYGHPCVVIDFGTATSFDVLGGSGDYEGGIIAPGVNVALDSLVKNTAKLPRIELAWPKTIIGKGTVHAMQSGSVAGYVCMVDGLVDLIAQELGELKSVVATGGLGRLMASHSKRINQYDPHLTLKGLQILAEIN
ncbi:MAG: type III pantothenate kinase [Proteobacteria bacterium]|nr:MAG: type III pantothenate kinase [Pseudomonadota bacterium]